MISYQNVIDLYFWYYDVRYHSRPTWKAQAGQPMLLLISDFCSFDPLLSINTLTS